MKSIQCFAKDCHYNQMSQPSICDKEPEFGYCTCSNLYIETDGTCGGKAIIEVIEELRAAKESCRTCEGGMKDE